MIGSFRRCTLVSVNLTTERDVDRFRRHRLCCSSSTAPVPWFRPRIVCTDPGLTGASAGACALARRIRHQYTQRGRRMPRLGRYWHISAAAMRLAWSRLGSSCRFRARNGSPDAATRVAALRSGLDASRQAGCSRRGQVRLSCCRGLRLAFQPLMTSAHSRPVFAPNKNTTTPHSHPSHCALRNESINSPAARATKSGCAAFREPLRPVRPALRLVPVAGVASRRARLARVRTRCASGHDLAACRR